MRAGFISWWFMVLLAACTKPNPEYCNDSSSCTNGFFCDVSMHRCVLDASTADAAVDAFTCSSDAECSELTTPICGTSQTCRGCELDEECPSSVCLNDGACEATPNVLYVSATGVSAGICSRNDPCSLAYALTQVSGARRSLRLSDGNYGSSNAISISGTNATIVGTRLAVFSRSTPGALFDIQSGADVTLRGITLTRGITCSLSALDLTLVAFNTPGNETRAWIDASQCTVGVSASDLNGAKAAGIRLVYGSLTASGTRLSNNTGAGIETESVTTIALNQLEISDNGGIGLDADASASVRVTGSTIRDNEMGGLNCVGTATYELVNNFIFNNGNNANATLGGVMLLATTPHRIEHNTIAFNERAYDPNPPLYSGGIHCEGSGSNANNLLAFNFHGNTTMPESNKSGTCDFSASVIATEYASFHFKVTNTLPFDLHLADGESAAVNASIAVSTSVDVDFDGQSRTDNQPDVGADEFVPVP